MRLKRYFVLGVLVAMSGVCSPAAPPASKAAAAFEKLKSLAGDWAGKDGEGKPAKSSFKLVAGKTAVLETLEMSGMDEMLTLYSVDGDTIVLVHYCPTNNQPRLRATPGPGEIKELVFSYESTGNLATPTTGHEQKLVIQFEDQDHITETWTWRANEKDTPMVYHLTRKPAR
jgi:hypothetical protein